MSAGRDTAPPKDRCFRHLLVTGGAGFIGSNFVRHALASSPQVRITNLDRLAYSGNAASLVDVERRCGEGGEGRYRFVHGDIADLDLVRSLLRAAGAGAAPVDAVVHFAAESHVDRSILGPLAFVDTNVGGTARLVEACRAELERAPRAFRFLHVSTDEVYGSLGPHDAPFTETTPLHPNSPYAASKAGSDLHVQACFETFGFPAVTTRCSNNYGPYQFPEKLIPLMLTRALQDRPLPVYGDGLNVRDWIHVADHCAALWVVLHRGRDGATYNIGGESEVSNLHIVRRILALTHKPESLIRFVTDRPGHDRRYAMDITRVRTELGWSPAVALDEGLARTVEWYLTHRDWWQPLLPESERVAEQLYRS